MDPLSRRNLVVENLRRNYLGPSGGDSEFLRTSPHMTYLVGTLFAAQSGIAKNLDGDDDTYPDADDGVIESANGWHPSSAALSFMHNGSTLQCTIEFGVYGKDEVEGNEGWRRRQCGPFDFRLSSQHRTVEVVEADYTFRLTSRWRAAGEGWLVTVALENLRTREADSPIETVDTLFQARLRASVADGQLLPYRSTESLGLDQEEEELALRYRSKEAYVVGHGTAVDWELDAAGVPVAVQTEPLPQFEVPAIDARESSSTTVQLRFLASCDEAPSLVCDALDRFIDEYAGWIARQRSTAEALDPQFQPAAERLIERARRSETRMRDGVQVLREDRTAQVSFALAMTAMREQMLQSRHIRDSQGLKEQVDPSTRAEPMWRPFQLGFLLLCLPSLIDQGHADRDLVDLIWFPTGGGKTEAYLGLAAIEIFRRRLAGGPKGGGTAVLTRYTLRLLTTQQFQRAATLICAMERLRASDPRLEAMAPFSIGLWVGNETTPGTISDAKRQFEATLKKKRPDNPFQLEACPWCGTSIMPPAWSENRLDYGVEITPDTLSLRCRKQDCDFSEGLPVEVIDERIYDAPPTIVLATVDKLARLPFNEKAGRVLGRGVPYAAPSLVIQDELHLLSGPLGTTVGVYETAVLGLIALSGARPKIVASTATIRAAAEQVLNLFARDVSLYPAAGLDEEDSHFAIVNKNRPGRLYIGLMPQAFTQSTSVVRSLTPLLESPFALESTDQADLDAYWTVVAYHNSLRELGRTVTLVRDDVSALLRTRGRGGEDVRSLRGDGLVELTSRVAPEDLPKELARLDMRQQSGNAVDVVASTNMLSVGIDVPRLSVMLMNGQPKTTSEYIQATSRVGRGEVPGIIVTLYRATRPRDRSHYEIFRAYHQSLYRNVEPTSVTPWSLASRERSLAGMLVAYMRHGAGLVKNDSAADFETNSAMVRTILDRITSLLAHVDPDEAVAARNELDRLLTEWAAWVDDAREEGERLQFDRKDGPSLTKQFGEAKLGWPVMSSMRSVDRQVRITVRGEG